MKKVEKILTEIVRVTSVSTTQRDELREIITKILKDETVD